MLTRLAATLAAASLAAALSACGGSSACSRASIARYGQQTAAKATRGLRADIKAQYAPQIAQDAEAVAASRCHRAS